MEGVAVYLLKSGLWIFIFWAVYQLFLKKETFLRFNRNFLLAGIAASFLLPLCKYKYTIFTDIPLTVNKLLIPAVENNSGQGLNLRSVLSIIYFGGIIFLLARYMKGFISIKKLIRTYGYVQESKIKIVNAPEIKSSFSIFNYMFISPSIASETEDKLIRSHEQAHIRQHHWIDLLLSHFLLIVQWFNPFAWLYVKQVKQNHEFLADEAVIREGNSLAVYSAVLINHSLNVPVFSFAHSFAQYNKFKRITMMKKQTSNPVKKLGTLLLVPAFATFLWAFSEPEFASLTSNQQVSSGQPADLSVITPSISNDLNPDSIVVVGQKGAVKKKTSDDSINLRGLTNEQPLIIIDGEIAESFDHIKPEDIESVSVLKDGSAIQQYGEKGKNGTIVITLKKAEKK